MPEVHIHIDEIVLDGVAADPREFRTALEGTLRELALSHAGDYPSGQASVLMGQPLSEVDGASVARSAWHSMIPAAGGLS